MAKQGMIIGGKYEILKEIGRGGMSIVYLAMDKNLNKQWAIKEIRHDVYGKEREMVVESFLTEANLMKKLDHPMLPRIVDIIDQNYVVMDYIEGESMDKVLARYGAQKQEDVIEWGKTLAEVLVYLHTRVPPIIYRDMKPSNIMLRPDGSIRLFDFGIAREYKREHTEDTTYLGTRGYAAPEQFGGQGQTDARTDVYSLGMTLHHLVTGKNPAEPPYDNLPIRHFNPALSSGLEWIIQKSIQLEPENRFQTSEEMLYALENVEKYSGEYKTAQKKKIHVFAGLLAAAAVSLAVGIGGMAAHHGLRNQNYDACMDGTVEGYMNAIEIDQSKEDAYIGWINLYYLSNENGEERMPYTAQEAKLLEGYLSDSNLEQLKAEDPKGYAEVCYSMGMMTWYYYGEDGTAASDNATLQMKIRKSIRWFKNVLDFMEEDGNERYLEELKDLEKGRVECYYNIGCFIRDREEYERGIKNQDDIYKEYFENVMRLVDDLNLDVSGNGGTAEVNASVELQVYDLIMYSLDSDIVMFKRQGVTRSEIQQLYDVVAGNIERLGFSPGSTDEQTQISIIERLDSVQKKINMAYEEGQTNE